MPQQSNSCDCGAFLLRYAEELCSHPPRVPRGQAPRTALPHIGPDWFEDAAVAELRCRLRDLVLELSQQQREKAAGEQEPGGQPDAVAAATAAAAEGGGAEVDERNPGSVSGSASPREGIELASCEDLESGADGSHSSDSGARGAEGDGEVSH